MPLPLLMIPIEELKLWDKCNGSSSFSLLMIPIEELKQSRETFVQKFVPAFDDTY